MCCLSTPVQLVSPNKLRLKKLFNFLFFVQRTGGRPENIYKNAVLYQHFVAIQTTLE